MQHSGIYLFLLKRILMYSPICADGLAKSPDSYFLGFKEELFVSRDKSQWERIPIREHIPNSNKFGTPYDFLLDLKDKLKIYGVESNLNETVERNSEGEMMVDSLVFFSPPYVQNQTNYALRSENGNWFLYRLKEKVSELKQA